MRGASASTLSNGTWPTAKTINLWPRSIRRSIPKRGITWWNGRRVPGTCPIPQRLRDVLEQRDPPQLTDQEIQDIGERIYNLSTEIYTENKPLANLLDASASEAIGNLSRSPELLKFSAQFQQVERNRLPRQMSELLRRYRILNGDPPEGRAGTCRIESDHLYDLTAVKEKKRLRNEEQYYARADKKQNTSSTGMRELLGQAQDYLLNVFDQLIGEKTSRRLLELRNRELEDASGVSRELIANSQILQCIVCGFDRYVKNVYMFLYDELGSTESIL